jgi:hypothetical protein
MTGVTRNSVTDFVASPKQYHLSDSQIQALPVGLGNIILDKSFLSQTPYDPQTGRCCKTNTLSFYQSSFNN